MAKAPIHVRLFGPGVSPDSVSAGDLAEFIKETEKAIQETAKADGQELPEEALISLIEIHAGSSDLTFSIDTLLGGATAEVTKAIAQDKFDKLPSSAWRALREISNQAVKKGWSVEFLPNAELPTEHAIISAQDEVPEPTPRTASGTTTIYAQCVRVGGVDPRALLRLDDGSTLSVRLPSVAIAKQLAPRLYDDVGLEGIALWDTIGWTLLDFEVVRILEYKPTTAVQAFRDLARASEGRWDDVDPDEYVNKLREP